MNLFWKKLFGSLYSTEKFEKAEAELIAAMNRYDRIATSPELKEYQELFHVVKSASFQENRHTLKNRKYKDTEEYEITKRFQKLSNSDGINVYYRVLQSDELAEYLEFEKSAEYELLGDKKKLKESERLMKFKMFENSTFYKIYVRFHGSFVVKEYEELKAKVDDPAFVKSNEFWANQDRWHTQPEYKQEMRFYELGDLDDIKFYLSEKPERFEKIRSLSKVFEDDFLAGGLDSKWQSGFYYNNPKLISNHSFANEKQAYSEGKNTIVNNGSLKIETKQQTVNALAWHTSQGFIHKDFSYTSDAINTGSSFNFKNGIVAIKIKCLGPINHAFSLATGTKSARISVFYFDGKGIKVGYTTSDKVVQEKVTGISPSEYYVFTLEWTEQELIWKINNLEVFRVKNDIPSEKMHLALNSFISENQKENNGTLQVEWVRAYQKVG